MNSRIGDSEIACSLFVRGKGGQKGNLRSRRKARLVVTFLQPVCSVVRENRAAAGSVPLFARGRSEGPDAGEDRIPGTGADGAAILRCFPVLRHSSASVRRPSAYRRASRSRNRRSPRSSGGRSRGCVHAGRGGASGGSSSRRTTGISKRSFLSVSGRRRIARR